MNYLVVDVANNVEILETQNCGQAIESVITEVANDVSAELFVEKDEVWYGWTNELGFIGPRPKHPPTR